LDDLGVRDWQRLAPRSHDIGTTPLGNRRFCGSLLGVWVLYVFEFLGRRKGP